MDEHKENIHAKNVSVKMANIKEDKVGVSGKLASCCLRHLFTCKDIIINISISGSKIVLLIGKY